MSRAFDGSSSLRGSKIMRMVYLDEAGISNPVHEPFVVVAGVAVHADGQFKEIEAHLDGLAEKHLPEDMRGRVAFHAMELFHGRKNFDRERWPLEKRLEILDDLAAIPQKFGLPICWGTTERATSPILLSEPVTPLLMEQINHGHAFFKFVVQIEIIMRALAKDEVAMLIAEDRPIMRKMLKMAHAILRGRGPPQWTPDLEAIKGELFGVLLPLDRIVETVHFAEKNESSLLQIADICAFAIKRSFVKASHWERLYSPLKESICFTPQIVHARASSAQPS